MDWESFMEQWDAVLQFVVIGQDWDDPVTLGDLVVATLIVFLANVVSRGLRRALTPLATRMKPYLGEAVVKVTLRVIHWVVLFLGVVVALNTIGVSLDSLSGLFTAGAVVTVAIGFAMQNIAQNFVSGAILAAERSIKSGDVVEVEGRASGSRGWGSEPRWLEAGTTKRSSSPTPRWSRTR
jgi:small-conductance mechanosensitive channel